MRKIFVPLLVSFAAQNAGAAYEFKRVATTNPDDPRYIEGATNLLGSPAMNSKGDVLFWSNGDDGEQLMLSRYSPDTGTYSVPVVKAEGAGFGTGHRFDVPAPVINDKLDIAYSKGTNSHIPLNITGCKLPPPTKLKEARGLKLLEPLLSSEKFAKLFPAVKKPKVEPFTNPVTENDIRIYRNNNLLFYPGQLLPCAAPVSRQENDPENPSTLKWYTYFQRDTLIGIVPPIRMNNLGQVLDGTWL